jgi:hypothetical protein
MIGANSMLHLPQRGFALTAGITGMRRVLRRDARKARRSDRLHRITVARQYADQALKLSDTPFKLGDLLSACDCAHAAASNISGHTIVRATWPNFS